MDSMKTVTRIEPLRTENKFKVYLDCGHFMIIDSSRDEPAKFGRRSRVNCLQCAVDGPPQFME